MPDEIIGKTHVFEDKLPVCSAVQDNYFERNSLTFKSKSQLIAYITKGIATGQTEFYFRTNGMFNKLRISEIAGIVAKIAASSKKGAVRVQQEQNEEVGTYWMRIY